MLTNVVFLTLQILMLKMISTHTSSHHCKSAAVSLLPSQDLQMDCNFFLTAIRLASLNQILDPWVYLLLREILLRKFCQVASAVSRCSLEGQKETQSLDVLNKKAIQNDNVHKQSLNMENCNLNGGNEEQWVGLIVNKLIQYFFKIRNTVEKVQKRRKCGLLWWMRTEASM